MKKLTFITILTQYYSPCAFQARNTNDQFETNPKLTSINKKLPGVRSLSLCSEEKMLSVNRPDEADQPPIPQREMEVQSMWKTLPKAATDFMNVRTEVNPFEPDMNVPGDSGIAGFRYSEENYRHMPESVLHFYVPLFFYFP